jgi:hypothetical protein
VVGTEVLYFEGLESLKALLTLHIIRVPRGDDRLFEWNLSSKRMSPILISLIVTKSHAESLTRMV